MSGDGTQAAITNMLARMCRNIGPKPDTVEFNRIVEDYSPSLDRFSPETIQGAGQAILDTWEGKYLPPPAKFVKAAERAIEKASEDRHKNWMHPLQEEWERNHRAFDGGEVHLEGLKKMLEE